MSEIRLQVVLAKAGLASRRKAASLIESGSVKVNGKVVKEKGFRVDISKDSITLNNKKLFFENKKYYILNKPTGVLSTASDDRGRKTVLNLIKSKDTRLYPVGRLDKDTTGLIIITNDGELTYRLTHPKFEIKRIYEVKVKGSLRQEEITRLKKGVMIEGKPARAKEVLIKKKAPGFTEFILTLAEGRKREVRNMMKTIGHHVLKLKRIEYGPIKLGTLKEGEFRTLTAEELTKLKKSVKI